MNNQKFYLTTALAVLILATGCQSLKEKTLEPITSIVDKDEENLVKTPAKVVGLWKEATLDNGEGKAIRGFAGRVYFLDRNEQAIKVDGQLVVYGFDDSNESQQRETPDKKFIIEPEGLAKKYSVSSVGPSYSVWLPWGEVGGYQKTIALVTVFKGVDGQVVRSEATSNNLPGKEQPQIAEREALLKELRQSIRGVNRSTSPASAKEQVRSSGKINTTTIPLSPNMQEKLESSEIQQSVNPAYPGVVIPAAIVPLGASPTAAENNVIPAYNVSSNSSMAKPISTTGALIQTSTNDNRTTGSFLR